MARAVGLDTGEFEVKVIELDGSYRRPRLSKVLVEPVATGSASAEDESHAHREAEATHSALHGGSFSRDNMSMAFPCREAVLRLLTVPFVGTDQIRKVIKFEAEGSIHSHNVDDMVVDFHTLGRDGAETRVLMAALPKAPLRTALNALEHAGIEPTVVDLDTMALYRVAQWCGAFGPVPSEDGEAGEEGEDTVPKLPTTGSSASFVLDLGARSTRVLVVENGELVDMRALRTGADSIAEEVTAATGISMVDARDAVAESLRTDEDFVLELGEDEADPELVADADADAAESEVPSALPARVAFGDVLAARDRYLSRLRRELVRFLTSVPASAHVETVWITGGASRITGVAELLSDVFGVRTRELDVLGHLNHKLGSEEAEELGPKIAVAVGLALRALGGPPGFNFRQEDLAFTKGFDRVKFPLAIACMLGLFLVLVIALRARRELTALEREYGAVYSVEESTRRGRTERQVLFNGYLGTLVNSGSSKGWFAQDRWFSPREYAKLVDKLLTTPVFNRLPVLANIVKSKFTELQRESGYYPELRLSSGLGALNEFAEVLLAMEDRLGRYQVHSLALKLPEGKGRMLNVDMAFRSDETSDFRTKANEFTDALREAAKKRDSAFSDVPRDKTSEKGSFSTPGGGEGFVVTIGIELKPESQYPVFPKSTP